MRWARQLKTPHPLILLLCFLLLTAPNAAADDPSPPLGRDGFNLTIEARLVEVFATVADRRGRFVDGLGANDFTLLDNGVSQKILYFSQEKNPLSIVLLVDSSESMLGRLEQAAAGLNDFIKAVDSEDRLMLVEFDSQARHLTGFTSDRKILRQAIGNLAPDGSTALYDALDLALTRLSGEEDRHRVIVLLSDGVDASFEGGSTATVDRVLRWAHQYDIRIFTIGLGVSVSRPELQRLASETGGTAHFSLQPGELSSVYRDIARTLRHQYLLAYQPPDFKADGRWHEIEVRVGLEGVEVGARKGYYAIEVPLEPGGPDTEP